jgi:hypothetical protein
MTRRTSSDSLHQARCVNRPDFLSSQSWTLGPGREASSRAQLEVFAAGISSARRSVQQRTST